MQSTESFLNRIFGSWIGIINRETLRADSIAALLGAVLVLPQAIAFATLAGLPAEYGLYTAIIPCAVAALFGSSRHVMSGPTNANSLALYAMLIPMAAAGSGRFIELALTVTILVGLIQLTVALLRLGTLANFISPSALMGFTSGAALLIALYALKDALGLVMPDVHGSIPTLVYISQHLSDTQSGPLLVASVTLVCALLFKKLNRKLPFMLIGIIAGTVCAYFINNSTSSLGIPKVPQVGAIPAPWPEFHLPTIPWSEAADLLGIAVALSIIALGQSISIAKAVAAKSGQHIDPNREFLGQGLSNLTGGFFSCYLSCGSLNRSLPNFESGAKTPLAAVFSAIFLMILVAISAPVLSQIPMAGISGLLLLVAWSLLDVPRWIRLIKSHRREFGISAITMLATILLRLEMAILLGTLLSLLSYLHRTSKPAMRIMGFLTRQPDRPLEPLTVTQQKQIPQCPQILMLRMEGSIYFGATQHVSQTLLKLREQGNAPTHLLVMARSMNFIDLSGAELWEQELQARRAAGGDLYFHRPRPEVMEMWQRTGFLDRLGHDHIFQTKEDAIKGIFDRLDRAICKTCQVRIFKECAEI
ncbi:SulP family inorganic anion transporter [Orrella sp. NBD-18]|uniref:SulP family inorganic anion transporter n=1 Tax=Sheuella amnicola TaxID=2707330 RepID=A0A6B2R0L8_9BURK|nr:SulP family inorganic anion transporter [Sheuella amnicola]